MNSIVAWLAKLLDPTEREWVCGDLAELKLKAPAAAANILGLVFRRQVAAWAHGGPWLALFGVAGLSAYQLSEYVNRVQTFFFIQLRTYLTYGVAYQSGGVSAEQQIIFTLTAVSALLLWLWACGFVLASLSGRALWMTILVFYLVLRYSWLIRMTVGRNIVLKHNLLLTMYYRVLPFEPGTILLLLALAFGVRSAWKGTLKRNSRLLLIALSTILIVLLTWTQTWFTVGFAHWSGQPYIPTPFLDRALPWLALAWPVFLIPFFQSRSGKYKGQRHSVK